MIRISAHGDGTVGFCIAGRAIEMLPLPIDAHLPRIVESARAARALVLVAEPGAGKTTRIPPALLRANVTSPDHPNIVMLQPRRVAARASAERIADENGWELGQIGRASCR